MLDALDERLRKALLGASPRAGQAVVALCALIGFAFVLGTRTFALADDAVLIVLLFSVPFALMLVFALRAVRGEGLLPTAMVCAVCVAAMLMRVAFADHSSGDFDLYLRDWLSRFAAGSFEDGMRQSVGEYNVLYQYILFLITRLPVPGLYAVKAVSFIGDALLAGAACRLCAREGRTGAVALCMLLLAPSIALNGGMFAQCDSLYACCSLWGLAFALEGRSVRSAICFALSLAFKLQAVFLLPIVPVLWAGRKLRIVDMLTFLGTLALCALPALLGGKPLREIVGIYLSQTGLYTALTYNAPNFFGLLNTTGLDVYAYGLFGIALALGFAAALVAWGMHRAQTLQTGDVLRLSLLLSLFVVFFLPRMHERYFYLANALALLCAARDRRFLPCAALMELSMMATSWDMGLPLAACSAMTLAAGVLAGCIKTEESLLLRDTEK